MSASLTLGAFTAVGVGAALGAWLRWLFGLAWNAVLPNLPLGTLIANLAGGYLIGIAVEWLRVASSLAPEWRLFLITGFLGGLTTFSTFSSESVDLLANGRYGWALLHTSTHLFGSILLTMLGVWTFRAIVT